MLVLTRKYQEKIRIGNNITITVLRTKGKAVRLGIEAPADVPVIRGELSFDHDAAPAAGEASTVAFEVAEPPKRPTCAGGKATAANWAIAPPTEPNVSLNRVPRSKVGDLLPLVSADAPLRAMMNHSTTR